MNAHQTRFAFARANLETCLERAQATYPTSPADDASEDTWMAYYEVTEDCDKAAGVYAARTELTLAERALIDWGKTLPSAKKSGLDFDGAARILPLRDKLLDILARVEA